MFLIIIILAFSSIGLIAYKFIPSFLRRYSHGQKVRMDKAAKQLDNMFIFTEKRRLLPIFTITPLSLGLLGFIILGNPIALGVGVILGLLLPPIIIKRISADRRGKFNGQLVDALMLISSSLKAGMSLNQSLEVLVEELPPPISDEFALVLRENQMGVALEECLAHLKQRIPLDDLDLIITAIGISRETGGDLTDVFSQLVFTMREKRKLEDRVRTLTVQGRLQGIIMGILPIVFAIFVYYTHPQNFRVMLTDKLGQTLLIWAVISELIGIILIKKLSKVEV